MAIGGSPITVDGGGSVTLDFDHNFYNLNGKKHKHTDDNIQVDRIEITHDGAKQTIAIGGKPVTIEIHLITDS